MKILHTADLHLRAGDKERANALVSVLNLGKKENIGALAISGDLFDSDADALKLKGELRELFSGLPYEVYIIPGNHDSGSFGDRAFFGSNIRVFRSHEDVFETDGLNIAGIPFKNMTEQDLYSTLRGISTGLSPDKINLLLYHGELLDSYYSRSDFGEEGDSRYMPVRLEFFAGLNFDYVLGGHFHTNFNAWDFNKAEGRGYFVYPGSPVSVTRRETGRRKVNLFTAGEAPSEVLLSTAHYERVTVKLDPHASVDPITAVGRSLDSENNNNSKILLSIEGYLNSTKHGIDETALNDFLESLKKDKRIEEVVFRATDLSVILEDYLYKTFTARTDDGNFPETMKASMKDYFLKAMTESL